MKYFRIVLIVVTLALTCVTALAIQRELFGIKLGISFEDTDRMLQSKYGKPVVQTTDGDWNVVGYLIDKTKQQLVLVSYPPRDPLKGKIVAVQIQSETGASLSGQDVCGVRLGDSEADIRRIYPNVAIRPSGDGYLAADTNTNTSVELKNGKVVSIRVSLSADPSRGGLVIELLTGEVVYVSTEELGSDYTSTTDREALMQKASLASRTPSSPSCAEKRR